MFHGLKGFNSLGSDDGIRTQTKLVLEAWNALNGIAELIEQVETLRNEIASVKRLLERDDRWKTYLADADGLNERLLGVERVFFDPRVTSAGDSFYYPPGLYAKLQAVARSIMESDFQPTAAQTEVAEMFLTQTGAQRERLDALTRGDVAAFNERLKAAGVPRVPVSAARPR